MDYILWRNTLADYGKCFAGIGTIMQLNKPGQSLKNAKGLSRGEKSVKKRQPLVHLQYF